MSDVYKSNEECSPGKRRKVLIMFGDVTSNKKLHPVVTGYLLWAENFLVPKYVRLNITNVLFMNIQNKRELQKTAINNLSGTEFKKFKRLYR